MDIDFASPHQAIRAFRLLTDYGVSAVYLPDLLKPQADPSGTHLQLSAVRVPEVDLPLTRAILGRHGLLPAGE
jgi:hypothetical protein